MPGRVDPAITRPGAGPQASPTLTSTLLAASQTSATLAAVGKNVTALQTSIDDDLQQLTDAAATRGTAVDARLEAIEVKLKALTEVQVPRLLTQQSGIVADLQGLTKTLNQLRGAVCSADSADGECKVALVPTCAAADISCDSCSAIEWDGDHGDAVPLGVLAEFKCKSGQFIDPKKSSTTSTCRATGWTKPSVQGAPAAWPKCEACIANCDLCTNNKQCAECGSGYRKVIGGVIAELRLDPEMVSIDPFDGDYKDADDLMTDEKKACLVDGRHFPNSWKGCPNHHRKCPASDKPGLEDTGDWDPAWVQLDLQSPHFIGDVTVWHYYADGRRYCKQSIKVSMTGEFSGEEETLWDTKGGWGDPETAAGNTVSAGGTRARYVRHYSGGSSANPGVHFLEMQVRGVKVIRDSSKSAKDERGTEACV